MERRDRAGGAGFPGAFASLESFFGALEVSPRGGASLPGKNAPDRAGFSGPGLRQQRTAHSFLPPDSMPLPRRASRTAQGDLFGGGTAAGPPPRPFFGSPVPVRGIPAPDALGSASRHLYEISAGAWDALVLAWMSEMPVEAAMLRFARRVIAAADTAGGGETEAGRRAARNAAADREDGNAASVLAAAYRTGREIDRMRGLLRFSPGERDLYLARCAPDHFVLPGLADHFAARFGSTPWAISDEKRGLVLLCLDAEGPLLLDAADLAEFFDAGTGGTRGAPPDGETELWRIYYRAVNNEARRNPALRKRFMPERYWTYLTEMSGPDGGA